MRLISRAAYAPLVMLGLGAALGCETPIPNTTPTTPPTPTAVYAVGPGSAQLQDVLLWETGTDPETNQAPQAAPRSPASYTTFRVEFDQTVTPATTAQLNTLGSFCQPLGVDPVTGTGTAASNIKLLDGTREIPSSVCYTPNPAFGSRPNVVIVAGSPAAGAAPFTCNSFTAATSTPNGANSLAENHEYTIQILPGVTGANGKTVQFPAAGSGTSGDAKNAWDGPGGNFKFTTSAFDLMVAGYIDPVTGFFIWHKKNYKGYMKNLFEQPNQPIPADGSSYRLIFTEAVKTSSLAGITVTRQQDNSVVDADVSVCGDCSATTKGLTAGRVVTIIPGGTWEPGVAYNVNVPASVGSSGTATLAAAYTIPFTAAAGEAPQFLQVAPGDLETGVAIQDYTGAAGTFPEMVFFVSHPVDPATVNATNITLKDAAGTAVPLAVALAPGWNNQLVVADAQQRLKANTTYTLTASGLKTKSAVSAINGLTFPTSTTTFTTAGFHTDPASSLAGGTFLPDQLAGGLPVFFNDTATGVTNTSLQLFEGTGATATLVPGTTVVVDNDPADLGSYPTGSLYILTPPSSFVPKWNTKYQIKAATSIKNPSGTALAAEACNPAGGNDCSEVTTIATAQFRAIATAIAGQQNLAAGGVLFTLNFGAGTGATSRAAADPASVNAMLADAPAGGTAGVRLFQLNPDTSVTEIKDAAGKPAVTCAILAAAGGGPANSQVRCSNTVALTANKRYLYSAVFTTDKPLKPAATQNGVTVDQVSGTFTGSVVSTTFTTKCQ